MDEKLKSIQELIEDRQRQLKKKSFASANKESFTGSDMATVKASFRVDNVENDIENNKRYAQLLNELDQAKLDILKLKEDQLRSKAHAQAVERQKKVNDAYARPAAVSRRKPEEPSSAGLGALPLAKPAPPSAHHDVEEMSQTIARDLTALKTKQTDLQNELVLTKQLLRNVEKNRMKITQEYLNAGKGSQTEHLSFRRKLAIQSIKEKLDQQAATLNTKELAANDLMQGVRRQEKLIN